MAVPILGEIERLITEHGSAAILKERIALASDQYAALDKKLLDAVARAQAAEVEYKNLESVNQRLELDNRKLKDEVRNLEEKLMGRHGQRLEEVKEAILLFLSARPHGGAIFADQIGRQCGIGSQVAMYHLEEMNERSLVLVSYSAIQPPLWSLGKEGRSYLVVHGLIS